MAGACGQVYRVDPAPCNALTLSPSGLLVPRTVLVGLAPGGAVGTAWSVDIDVSDTGGADCPDTWQIGARLSPVSGEAVMAADTDLLATPGNWVPTSLTITLPEAGRYRLSWNVLGQICATTSGGGSNRWLDARVVNSATGVGIGQVRTVVQHQLSSSVAIQACVDATAPIDHLVTVATGPLTLRREAAILGPGGKVQSATVVGSSRTTVTMHKIGD
ncbi:hypothetical protein [Streptomyces eurythermus]